MEETVLSAHAADATRITVVLRLIVVVEEVADEASVLAEADATLLAVRLHLLTSVAFRADQLLQLLAVERVALRVIVAESATVDLPAARALNDERSEERIFRNNSYA